jgi:hypothetical protein
MRQRRGQGQTIRMSHLDVATEGLAHEPHCQIFNHRGRALANSVVRLATICGVYKTYGLV